MRKINLHYLLPPMRVLFLENHDSFSWNVIDALPVERHEITIENLNPTQPLGHPSLSEYDCLIIGPGPTDPIRAGLIDIVKQAASLRIPTLGICLGHQAIGLAFGAQLSRTSPVHGKRSEITFSHSRLFPNTIGIQTVMRYHSLSLANVQAPMNIVAITHDGIPIAIEHESLPIAGLQFHPDSYATVQGLEMLADFFEAIR